MISLFELISSFVLCHLMRFNGKHTVIYNKSKYSTQCNSVQGAPIKNNPLEKILYLRNCSRFFHQIYAVYRGGFRPCIQQIAFKYLVWFQNYNSRN